MPTSPRAGVTRTERTRSISSLLKSSKQFADKGNRDKAQSLLESVLLRVTPESDWKNYSEAQYQLAELQRKASLFAEASKGFFQLLHSARMKQDNYRTGAALLSLGIVQAQIENFHLALEFMLESYEIDYPDDAEDHRARIAACLVPPHHHLGDLEGALRYAAIAMEHAERSGNLLRQVHAILNITNFYVERLDFEKAFEHALVLVEKARTQGDAYFVMKSTYTYGNIQMHRGHYEESERFMLEAYAIAEKIHDTHMIMWLDTQLAELYGKSGKLTDSIVHYKKALSAREDHQRFTNETMEVFKEKHKPDPKSRLAKAFPSLSPAELRISLMLISQLSSKEIASTLNISLQTVNRHRHNIRLKVKLGTGDSLTNFLARYSQ